MWGVCDGCVGVGFCVGRFVFVSVFVFGKFLGGRGGEVGGVSCLDAFSKRSEAFLFCCSRSPRITEITLSLSPQRLVCAYEFGIKHLRLFREAVMSVEGEREGKRKEKL